MRRLAIASLAAIVAACGPAPDTEPQDAPTNRTERQGGGVSPAVESEAGAARRVAQDAESEGAPGVTEPVYDPRLADQPGRSWETRAALEADRARDNPPAK